MCKNKHLSLDDRLIIERELSLGKSFKYIGNLKNKDCTTISKEVRNHYKIKILVDMVVFSTTVFIEMIVKLLLYVIIVINLKIDYAVIVFLVKMYVLIIKKKFALILISHLMFVIIVRIYLIVLYQNIFMKVPTLLMNINKFFLKLDLV